MIGFGNNLNDLKSRIQQLHRDIEELGDPIKPLEQMTDNANILRENEYLSKANARRIELVSAYLNYTKQLEQMVSSLFSIQSELKEIIKTEVSPIESEDKPKKIKKKIKIIFNHMLCLQKLFVSIWSLEE